MTFEELTQTRRSVRSYQAGCTVSREDVEKILRSAQLAPTWKNSQTGRYYVAITPEKAAQVKKACLPPFNQKNSANAPVLIVTAFEKNQAGFTKGQPDNELGNEWGSYDLGLQSAYLVLQARELGLDTLIMGIRDAARLREIFDIPESQEIAAVIALGYREGEPAFRPRKELQEIAAFY
ncbi:MAG: nitroreductase family protein [Lachnospiraceae bacterium]|nr:nitroreductase family protein [Lachnospiraceae bacterium]